MRALFSLLSRFSRHNRGVPEPPSCFFQTAPRGIQDASGAPSVITRIVAGLRDLLVFSMIAGGVYWMALQDWSTGGADPSSNADGDSLEGRQASVLDLSWSSNGETFLSRSTGRAGGGNFLLLHRFGTNGAGGPVSSLPIFTGEERVWKALLLPDASAVISIGDSRIVSRFDLETGVRSDLINDSEQNQLTGKMALSSDGTCLAVEFDGEVRLIELCSGEELQRLAEHDAPVADLAFSDDNRWIAAGLQNGTVLVWDRSSGASVHELTLHQGSPVAVRFVGDSRRLASVGIRPNGALGLWELESGRLLWQASTDRMGLPTLAVSTNGSLAATGGHEGVIVLWNLDEHVRLREISGHEGAIHALHFLPDDTALTSASSDGRICVWDVRSARLLSSIHVDSIAGSSR